jgi:hypothetical protein
MTPLIYLILFILHTIVFGWLYIRKRHLYHLIFTVGFICLIIYYSALVMKKEIEWLEWVRWLGIALFAVATPPLLIKIIRMISGRNAC